MSAISKNVRKFPKMSANVQMSANVVDLSYFNFLFFVVVNIYLCKSVNCTMIFLFYFFIKEFLYEHSFLSENPQKLFNARLFPLQRKQLLPFFTASSRTTFADTDQAYLKANN
ncbi:unnamed protein product [Meloidogyne enterolobii]|uniref:Uncharacterized protein n=2 Tax=Meloidogyne enterolobii TaxID=390850 RepID=A0ACB0XQ41_MELEN|nr:unnamed protein product [Meloidogyne enterolobii]